MKCFLCLRGNVNSEGICDNPNCARHKPLNPPKETKAKDEKHD